MPPEKELTLEQRKALALARARKRKAESQKATPSLDSNLRTVNVPDRIMGVKLPNFGPQTEVVSNAAEGYQIALPANAPREVQRGIVEGVQSGTERRRRQANLATEGATALATNRFVAPTSGFVGDVANRFSGGRNKTLERIGAASAGGQDVASFGFGDELGGLLHGEGAKLKQRQLTSDAFKEHPLSAVVGALPTMVIPGQTARGLTTLAKAGSAALRTGLPAAIYGYGSGEGGPLSADRGAKAAVYGAGGALLGGGFELGGRGLEFAGRNILGSAELRSVASHLAGRGSSRGTIKLIDQAITEVQRAARVDGQSITRDIAKQRLTDAVMRAEANDMLGDLVPGGVTSMEGSALPGMEGADLVVSKLRERGEGQYQRINQAVGRIVDGEDIQSSLANLARIKEEEAGPLYQAAFAPGRVSTQDIVNHPRFAELQKLVQLDDFKRGQAAGERVWKLTTGDSEAQFRQLGTFEQIDWIKKGLDAEIGRTLRAGDDTTARALINAKNRMLSIADDMNPDYAQARRVWAGAESQREALLLGESLLSSTGKVKSGQALRDIQDQYASYSEAEKTAFSIGLFERAVQASGDVIESGTANSAKRNFLAPNTQRELRNFLPEEQADEFLSLIEREYRQQLNANQALSGSPTGRRIHAGEAVRMATGGARAAAAELSDPQGLIRKGQEAIRNTIGNNPRVQRRFAEFLTRSAEDPNLRKALGVEALPQLPPPPGGAPAAGAATSAGSPPPGAADLPMKGDTKQGYSNKDKALDAASLSLIAGGSAGSADAQTLTVSDRISGQQQEIARIDQEREAIKRDLAILNAPLLEDEAANRKLVSQKQRILKSRVDGTLKIDGAYGPLTDSAVKSLRTELATSLEGNATEMEAARDRLASLEIALAEERNPGPQGFTGFLQKQLPTISMIAGGALGLRTRGGAVKQSQKDALAMEQRLNRLVDPNAPIRSDFETKRGILPKLNPLDNGGNQRRADELAYQEALQNHPPRTPPTFTSGPQGINNRATAANEWYQLGGADKHSSPFTQKADGDYVANAPKNVADPTKLFKGSNNPFKIKDAGWIGGGLFESGVSTKYLEDEKAKLKEAQGRLNQALEAKDPVAYEAALKDIQQHETMISVYGGLQRFGLGVAGLRTIGALKSPYAKPLPSKRLATREVGSIKHSITNKKQGATGNSSGY